MGSGNRISHCRSVSAEAETKKFNVTASQPSKKKSIIATGRNPVKSRRLRLALVTIT